MGGKGVKVSKIDKGIEKKRSNEDRVHLSDGTGQEDQPSSQAQIPE